MGYRSSGNSTVDAMGSMAITGNVIPEEWYKHILRPATGKPHLLAITILADLVYWHRPTEVRDERTGEVIGWKKKFHGDMLQKSYQEYATKFGECRKTIKNTFDLLVDIGVIKRFFFNIEYADGRTVPNQMFIDLDIAVLKDISYPAEEGGTTAKQVYVKMLPTEGDETPIEENGILNGEDEMTEDADKMGILKDGEKFFRISGIHREDMVKNFSGYPDNNFTISPPEFSGYGENSGRICCKSRGGYPEKSVRTYTENNTKTDTEDKSKNTTESNYINHILSISQESEERRKMDRIDGMDDNPDYLDEVIRSNINYDWHMENDDITKKEDIHGLYLVMHDVVCGNHTEPIFVNKTPMDPEVVKKRFLQLNDQHLEYVIDCLQENPNEDGIRDIRSYIITCLYNAPATMGQYYRQKVNHDYTKGAFRKKNE